MGNEATRYTLSYETLQPLTVFRSLRFLAIEWSEQISLDDDEVVNSARSWPMLQVFSFHCDRGNFSTKPSWFAITRHLFPGTADGQSTS